MRDGRERLGITQQDLAGELGVTHQHISRIEAGTVAPSLALLVKIAAAFGVTTDFLLTGNDGPPSDLRGAIRADPRLSAETKRNLLGLIDELRHGG